MKRVEIQIGLLRGLQRSRRVVFGVGRVRGVYCYEYEDGDIYFSMSRIRDLPRIVARYITTDTMTVLQPLLRCMSSFASPLAVYLYMKRSGMVDLRRSGRLLRIYRSFVGGNYPTLYSLVEMLPEDVDEMVVVDGSDADLVRLLMCPARGGLFVSDHLRTVIYVGSS